jgi:hypothetical protein
MNEGAGSTLTDPAAPNERPVNRTVLRTLARIRRHPSGVLLIVQLAGLLLYPFIETEPAGRALLGAFSVLVLALAIRMVSRTHGRVWIGAGLALPAVLLNVLHLAWGMSEVLPWSALLEALFYFYAAACLIDYMLDDNRATTDELFAAGATFTLLAWGFTYLFVLCQALQPGCIASVVHPELPRSWTELMFLSFALLSSTGIGDVIPVTVHTRALASLEMFVGVMYLALVVSRLIGFAVRPRADD